MKRPHMTSTGDPFLNLYLSVARVRFAEFLAQTGGKLSPTSVSLESASQVRVIHPQTQTSSNVPAHTFRVAALKHSPSPTAMSASLNNSLSRLTAFCSSWPRIVPEGSFSIDLSQSHSNNPSVSLAHSRVFTRFGSAQDILYRPTESGCSSNQLDPHFDRYLQLESCRNHGPQHFLVPHPSNAR